jgi:ABC-2 type transport system ATP-binding protein
MTTTAIRVQGIQKSYKDLQVLRGVDFEVEKGSIFALLGSNGAGKTTMVRILSTLLKADAGTASVQGHDVAAEPLKVRESISLTGQFAAVDEVLTGRENLVLVAKLRHLAKSLVGRPEVIYLDEPTTGLDPEARIEVWEVVKELANTGTTVLLTTQYLDEAEQLADRIAILHQGTIIANGTLADLKQLLPAAKVEYVEKQPTLEEIFLTLIGPGPSTGSGTQRKDVAA